MSYLIASKAVFFIVCGIFWKYGKESRAGKWTMMLTFIGFYIAFFIAMPFFAIPLIGGIISTSIVGIILSHVRDEQRRKTILQRIAEEKGEVLCPVCRRAIRRDDTRCISCGASLVFRG